MSWRERLQTAKFRNVEFLWEDNDTELGRRTVLHEYPGRDIPYVEDLGRKARSFSMQVFVLGDDYDLQRNKLIEALEQEGPGTLVHPNFGSMQVSVISVRQQESSREGRMCRFSINFIESGSITFPGVTENTAGKVDVTADQMLTTSQSSYTNLFTVAGQAEFFVQAIQDDLDDVLRDLETAVGDVTGAISAVIRTPANMAVAIVGAVGKIKTDISEPQRAFSLYRYLFNAGNTSKSVPLLTFTREQQATNQQQVHLLIQRTALAEACRLASTQDYTSREDATRLRDDLLAEIDIHMEALHVVSSDPIDDDVYSALMDLRVALHKDLTQRGAQLPLLIIIVPVATVPALVVAHQVYGDATHADDIVARNNIRHPGFMIGGDAIEVIADAS